MDNATQILAGAVLPQTQIGGAAANAASVGALQAQTLTAGDTIFTPRQRSYREADGVTVNGALSVVDGYRLPMTETIIASTEGNTADARLILFDPRKNYKNQSCNSCNSEIDEQQSVTISAGSGAACGVSAYADSFLGEICSQPRIITSLTIYTERKVNNVWSRVDANYNVVVYNGNGRGVINFQNSFNTVIHENRQDVKAGVTLPLTGRFARLDAYTAWDFGMIPANTRITFIITNYVEVATV